MTLKYGTLLNKIAIKRGGSIQDVINRLVEEQRNAFQMSKPEIKTNALFFDYYDISQSTAPLAEVQQMYYDRLTENLELLDMTEDKMKDYAVKKGISKSKLRGKEIGDIAYLILSGGYTKEEVDKFLEAAVVKEEEREVRYEEKWEGFVRLGENIDKIRARYHKDLERKRLSKEKVLATVIGLMDESLMRIGSEKSVEEHGTYGASTLTHDMLTLNKKAKTASFDYVGKKQVVQSKKIEDPVLFSSLVQIYEETKGKCPQLFCYKEGGKFIPITDRDVREYLNEIAETTHTHHFRFLHGSELVRRGIEGDGRAYSDVVAEASMALGHVRTDPVTGEMVPDVGVTAQKHYVMPHLIAMYGKGRSERNPVYFKVKAQIADETKQDTSNWTRSDILDYLRTNPDSSAWPTFLS